MDAEQLEFPDNSFDVVVAQYVVTAVPNPEAALDEFARVLRPGGEIVILTRVGADTGLRRVIEKALHAGDPQARLAQPSSRGNATPRLGRAPTGIELVERRPMPPLGHFSLIRFRKVDVRSAPERLTRSRVARVIAPLHIVT